MGDVFVGYNVTDDTHKKAIMLTYGGEDLNDIFNTFSVDRIMPQPNTDQTTFTKAVKVLLDYFNPR